MRCIVRFLFFTLLLFAAGHASPAQAQRVRISGLQDVTIREWGLGDPSINRYFDICIYRQDANSDSRKYGLMVTGDGPGFFMRSGMYHLRYTAFINDGGMGNPGGGRSYRLISGVPVFIDLNHARIAKDKPENSNDCNGNSYPTARITINSSSADLDKVPDGTYRGVINLTLMPL